MMELELVSQLETERGGAMDELKVVPMDHGQDFLKEC